SRGIGRAIATTLAAEGCAVAICARGADDLEATATELRATGATVHAVPVDITDTDALTGFVTSTVDALDGLDLVVHNAAAMGIHGQEQWRASFETDLMAFVRLAEAAAEPLTRSGGAIVVIATTSASDVSPPSGARSYGALKAALIHHAAALGQVLGPQGVRVNVVSPGPIEFADGSWARRRSEDPDYYEGIRGRVALGRLGTVDEVARAVAFLGSPAASFCVGSNLVVDGGLLTRVAF
ncbi:MAG: SDR family oxidoreductase, partial [Geodermatophilaceae bacterium]|nr:SDR family oxidoreductase [Geodermatophilaceae bacterium]